MNMTFNIQRFTRLFINEWLINKKKLALFWGGMVAFPALFFMLTAVSKTAVISILGFSFFFTLVMIFQALIISVHYHDLTSKNQTQSLLLLPASQTEKFMAKFINCAVIFPLLALCYIWIMMQVTDLYNDWAKLTFNLGKPENDWLRQIVEFDMIWISLICAWIFNIAIFLWGAHTFKKWIIVKTFLFWLIFTLLLIPITGCIYALMSGHFPKVYIPFIINDQVGPDYNWNFSYSVLFQNPFLYHWISVIISLLLIIIARVKYNEKTV